MKINYEGMIHMIEIGRIVVKTAGREALKKAVVVDIIDRNYVLITGPPSLNGIKRRRANIKHLESTPKKLSIKRKATDEDVLEAAKADKLDDFLQEKITLEV
jgi:large subunit ribosomal protein L14e